MKVNLQGLNIRVHERWWRGTSLWSKGRLLSTVIRDSTLNAVDDMLEGISEG